MPSSYPAAIDNFTNPTAADNLDDAPVLHTTQHTNVNDAVKAIETELGTNPKGAALSVKDRLVAIEASIAGKANSSLVGAANGIATLDAGSRLVQGVDASKVNAGTLAVARIPNLSGAKILGTGSGGAVIPLDAVPDLPASRTTSGIFDAARIPGLDGSKITTGTIAAARLPSSVTSNANSRVVADVAGRDAIPLVDRVDGMIVTVRTPWAQYTWRADNSTWNQSGGPGYYSETPLEDNEQTDLTTAVTSFNAGAPGLALSFTAPKSGAIFVTVSAHLQVSSTGSGYFGAEVRTTATIGGGVVQDPAITDKAVAIGGVANARNEGSYRYLVSGLTVGSPYHVRTMFLVTAGNLTIFSRRLLIEMAH